MSRQEPSPLTHAIVYHRTSCPEPYRKFFTSLAASVRLESEGVRSTDRREFFKKSWQFALSHKVLGFGLPGGTIGAALADLETRDLTLRKLNLSLKDWPLALNNYRISQLSDLHLETLQIQAEKIAGMSNSLDPDLLVITGDVISSRGDMNKVIKFLDPLKARDGKFIVMGNNDYAHFSHTLFKHYVKLLESLGFHVLINAAAKVTSQGAEFWIVGVDDPATAHDDVDLAFSKVPEDNLPRIVLAHSTDCIDDLYSRRVDLFLAGHTHGGQVQLPFIGPPIRNTLLAEEGVYEGYHRVNGINVYINRGIGTSGIPLRIGVKPEVTSITLATESQLSASAH